MVFALSEVCCGLGSKLSGEECWVRGRGSAMEGPKNGSTIT